MSSKPFDPKGKIIVVTGGGNGIGAGLCIAFAKADASTIVICDIDMEGAQRTAEKCEMISNTLSSSSTSSKKMIARRVDVTLESSIATLIKEIEETMGPIDLFVANAGILPRTGCPDENGLTIYNAQFFPQMEEVDRVFAVNFHQLIFVAKYLIPLYLNRGRGHILVTASAVGLLPIASMIYATSKAAAVSFTEWLSITYGSRGVGVCCLCPQIVRSNMTTPPPNPEQQTAASARMKIMGDLLEVQDVASCTLDALAKGQLFAFPHPEVHTYVKRKTDNPDRWIKGMRRLNAILLEDAKEQFANNIPSKL